MVPPAFSEVGHDVLPRQFDDLVEDVPEVKQPEVPYNEGGEEPVNQVHNVIMIEVVPDVS